MEKTKILFVIPDLYSGGAQRVFINLLKSFSRDKFSITLIVLIKAQREHFVNDLPNDIHVCYFNLKRTMSALLPLAAYIRKKKPDVVFSTLTHLNFILGIVKLFVNRNVLFVGRESSIISLSIKDEKFSALFQYFYRRVYQNLDLIICQSKVMASDLIKNFKITPSSVTVIYNPVDLELIGESTLQTDIPSSDKKEIQFLCVGRLYPVKGYDRLFKLLTRVSDLPYRLTIIGDGPLRSELEQLSSRLKIGSRIHFLGIQENPFKFMANADCLLMSSYYEGLPNVVLEANACGLPVIAFNAAGGIGEIIIDGLNGWLIEDGDEGKFAEKLCAKDYLKLDKTKIARFASERFSLPKITKQYEDAILSLRKTHD